MLTSSPCRTACCALLLASLWALGPRADAPKLTAADVVSRHLAALGSAEALAGAQTRTATGIGRVVNRLGGYGRAEGSGAVVSQGRKTRIEFGFQSNEYPGEALVCDGERVGTTTFQPGRRTELATFVKQYDVVMKDGLLGGALTTAWPLLDLAGRLARLDYRGLKETEGRMVHELRYRPRRGSDLTITLHFDADTFRHVRTRYQAVQPAGMANSPTQSSAMRERRYTLLETFDDFREAGGIALPHAYTLQLSIEGQGDSVLADWGIEFREVSNNTTLDPQEFALP